MCKHWQAQKASRATEKTETARKFYDKSLYPLAVLCMTYCLQGLKSSEHVWGCVHLCWVDVLRLDGCGGAC